MNGWHYFLWLCEQAADFIVFPPFLICSAVLSIVVAALCIGLHPIKSGLWKSSYWLVFTQMLFYPAVLAVATLGASTRRPSEPNRLASTLSDILFWASLALAGFWIWRMKGLRWLAFSLVALQQLLLYGSFLTAEMAIGRSMALIDIFVLYHGMVVLSGLIGFSRCFVFSNFNPNKAELTYAKSGKQKGLA